MTVWRRHMNWRHTLLHILDELSAAVVKKARKHRVVGYAHVPTRVVKIPLITVTMEEVL